MQVIGTNFSEVSVKRNKFDKDVRLGKVGNNITIDSVETTPVVLDSIGEALVFNYTYSSAYQLEEPKEKLLGEIVIKGDVVVVEDKKKAKNIIALWEKDKKLEPDVMHLVMNVALGNAQIEAIAVSRKVMLPSPLPLPSLNNEQTSGKAQ